MVMQSLMKPDIKKLFTAHYQRKSRVLIVKDNVT